MNNKVDIWYIDEAGFNINVAPNYGWSRKGKAPTATVPTKQKNTSLLLAISRNKKCYF